MCKLKLAVKKIIKLRQSHRILMADQKKRPGVPKKEVNSSRKERRRLVDGSGQ